MIDESKKPPQAPKRARTRTLWGDDLVDPYPWLRDVGDPAVVEHLEKENAYTRAVLAGTTALRDRLFEEIRSRVKETDLSVPVTKDGWSYYSRTEEGLSYAIHCRRPEGGGEEQIIFDENLAAAGSDYFDLGVFEVSPDHRLLLWGADLAGDERFDLRVRDLDAGRDLDDVVAGCSAGSAWAVDNTTFFYLRLDDAHRPHQVWRHHLGTSVGDDVLVFEESDQRFYCGVGRDRDDSFIQIGVSSAVTDEVWLVPADQPTTAPVCFDPRREGREYGVSHRGNEFLILTNDGAHNFALMRCPDDATTRSSWNTLVPHRPDVMLSGFDWFESHLVLFERAEGLTRLATARWVDIEAGSADDVSDLFDVMQQPETVYSAWPGANPVPTSTTFRYGYSSLVSPATVYAHDLLDGSRQLLKQQEVLGGFDPAEYVTRREWAKAPDGTRVPMSLVMRQDRDELNGGPGGPVLLYGYGAYEISIDPVFSSARLSLLDRGFAFAIAHVRGGGELGRSWYEDGKFERKPNTFSDTISCARHLIDTGLTAPRRLVLRGGSAGGLLVGAVLNEVPELFGAAVAEVPFVDPLSTMLDPSLPLTVTEWEEWGNPEASREIYQVMKGYAPVQNVRAADYPPVLATTGLSDPRVGFWEPAKWVLALRERSTSGEPALLKAEIDAGHGGPTGRYDAWRDEAETLAFILWALGIDGLDTNG